MTYTYTFVLMQKKHWNKISELIHLVQKIIYHLKLLFFILEYFSEVWYGTTPGHVRRKLWHSLKSKAFPANSVEKSSKEYNTKTYRIEIVDIENLLEHVRVWSKKSPVGWIRYNGRYMCFILLPTRWKSTCTDVIPFIFFSCLCILPCVILAAHRKA